MRDPKTLYTGSESYCSSRPWFYTISPHIRFLTFPKSMEFFLAFLFLVEWNSVVKLNVIFLYKERINLKHKLSLYRGLTL